MGMQKAATVHPAFNSTLTIHNLAYAMAVADTPINHCYGWSSRGLKGIASGMLGFMADGPMSGF